MKARTTQEAEFYTAVNDSQTDVDSTLRQMS